ncbi:MAG: DUF354 domain-containing protein [Pyrinomonadaceae bacterium]
MKAPESEKKNIWIDLGNSPHVPFFQALAREFESRGHEILWTARDYAQTVELARQAGLDPAVFGTHGGKRLPAKIMKFAVRVMSLINWSRRKRIDLAISHNSLEPLAVARLLGIPSVNLMDYEHHPNNHISFRLARRVIVPISFPSEKLKKFGARERKVRRFDGIKEDVYLADFSPRASFQAELRSLGILPENILVIVRPDAPDALYNRQFENNLLEHVLDRFARIENARIVVLPRTLSQGDELKRRHSQSNIIFPKTALPGADLIAAADLVVSGGGTMNREAAALGVPAATIFTGHSAAIDEYLVKEGRMLKIGSREDIDMIHLTKKSDLNLRGRTAIRTEVADLILEPMLETRK